MMQLNISPKGEIVIPKKIRETFGLLHANKITLEVKGNFLILKPINFDLVKQWEANAKKYNLDVNTLIYGDKLYEEIF